MHLVPVGQTFDRGDLGAVGLHGKHQTCSSRLAVEQDGAGATDTMFASEVRAGEADVFADHVSKRSTGFNVEGVAQAIDRDVDLLGAHAVTPIVAAASARPRRVRTPAMCLR